MGEYLSVSQMAERWGVSERSVRNYCAQGRVPGAFLAGKTWSIPADAEKPLRLNARPARERDAATPLLHRLREEKGARVSGGIYHRFQIEFTYNSNHIEGSRLSREQTRLIFETATIGAGDEPVRVDDVIEASNHFRAIDYVIDNAERPLGEAMIKELHRILKTGTTDQDLAWFAVGDYKRVPNEVGGRETTAPEDVASEMAALLERYRPAEGHTVEEIVAYHVAFERILPFQDGNGRVGRLVMLKECLANGLVPWVIADDMKVFYYRGLAAWDRDRAYLIETCLAGQDRVGAWLDYFQIPR